MKRTFALVAALTAGTVSIASAENQAPWERPQTGYVFQPDEGPVVKGDAAPAVPGFSNVIYLNNCKPNGCLINPGGNNSTTTPPRSSIPNQQVTVRPFAYSDSTWNQVVDCVKKTYAAFGVTIVDQRPTSGNYHMAIVAGYPQDIGMQQGVGGVSPFTCGYIPNALSFSFANVYGGSVDDICWTVAQETAHSWGLDHKFDNRDPMTYLSGGPSRKTFQNSPGPCGEYQARSCQCGGSQMNSFQEIMQTFGGSTPTPPTVDIQTPKEGDIVAAMFPIKAAISDDISVTKAELYIDGQLVNTSTQSIGGVFVWNAPASIGQGNHTIKVIGYDVALTKAEVTVNVTLGAPCKKPGDCSKDTDTCVDGRCVPGSGVQGGLGSACVANTDCASGQCGADADGNRYCVEQCNVEMDACPSGFDCISAGASGVCWPGEEEDTGCSSNQGGATPGLLLLGLFALLVTRRRR